RAQVIFDRGEGAPGPSVVTVFTDADGAFRFPGAYTEPGDAAPSIAVRALGYEQVDEVTGSHAPRPGDRSIELTFVVRAVQNQAAVAPASAWLARIEDRA